MNKSFLFLIFVILVTSQASFSQSHYSGQRTLSPNYFLTENGQAYNLNFQKLVGDQFLGYRIDAVYLVEDYNINLLGYNYNTKWKVLSIAPHLVYSLEDIISHPFYVQLYVGPLYQYEVLNNNNNSIGGIEYNRPKQHSYGASLGVELELILIPGISFVVNLQDHYTNSDIKQNVLLFGAGLRITL